MTPEQFCYWLQGFSEVTNRTPMDKEWKVVQDHLATVFKKVTPDRSNQPAMPSFPPTPPSFPQFPPQITC